MCPWVTSGNDTGTKIKYFINENRYHFQDMLCSYNFWVDIEKACNISLWLCLFSYNSCTLLSKCFLLIFANHVTKDVKVQDTLWVLNTEKHFPPLLLFSYQIIGIIKLYKVVTIREFYMNRILFLNSKTNHLTIQMCSPNRLLRKEAV